MFTNISCNLAYNEEKLRNTKKLVNEKLDKHQKETVVCHSENLTEAIQLPTFATLPRLFQASILLQAMAIAFIASTESLLSAVAVDRLHNGRRTNFDQELAAQGLGNIICGFLGALPMTGVIVRSFVNVEAGAKTRLSAMLHGLWLLILVICAPTLLRMIPTSSLAAVLVFTPSSGLSLWIC